MTRGFLVGAGLAALVAIAIMVRPRPEAKAPPKQVPVKPSPPVSAGSKPAAAEDPGRLRPFIVKLGRAALFNDSKTLAAAARSAPPVYENDAAFIIGLLRSEDVVLVAGAAWMGVLYEIPGAVAETAAALRRASSLALKRVLVLALARRRAKAELAAHLPNEPDPVIRALIVSLLRSFAKDDPALYSTLLSAACSDADVRVRAAAAPALTLDDLLVVLRSEADPAVQLELVSAAYEAGGDAVLPPLQAVVLSNPGLSARLREIGKRVSDARYRKTYPSGFFADGGLPVPYQPGLHRRIGITVDTGDVGGFARALFAHAPLDRYRGFFYLRRSDEFEADVRQGETSPRAYDGHGQPIPGGVPQNELDSTVFVVYVEPASLPPGVTGYSEGTEAYVTAVSLHHEFGHAFAGLGDEYSHIAASDDPAENLEPRSAQPRWHPLIEQGHLPPGPFLRVERDANGNDIGRYQVPSDSCFLNNRPTDARYCPVCQLELIARICELSGAAVPW